MGLSRTFVGFSSTDIHYYRLMLAWKENEHIDFNPRRPPKLPHLWPPKLLHLAGVS